MGNVVRLLSTLALRGALVQLAEQYQAAKGVTLDADYAPTVGLLKRLRDGEKADVLILTQEGLDELIEVARTFYPDSLGEGSVTGPGPATPEAGRVRAG